LNDVSGWALRPSRSATHSSGVPDRWLSNTTRVPSGENCAFSSDRVDSVKLTGLPALRRPEPILADSRCSRPTLPA
jgi:hypothetical protein